MIPTRASLPLCLLLSDIFSRQGEGQFPSNPSLCFRFKGHGPEYSCNVGESHHMSHLPPASANMSAVTQPVSLTARHDPQIFLPPAFSKPNPLHPQEELMPAPRPLIRPSNVPNGIRMIRPPPSRLRPTPLMPGSHPSLQRPQHVPPSQPHRDVRNNWRGISASFHHRPIPVPRSKPRTS